VRSPDHRFVQHQYVALADSAHRELGLERDPELADKDHIQGRAERLRHLERDRYPTPRQAQHDHVLTAQMPQPTRQLPPRVHTIDEWHRNLPRATSLRHRPCG
jgi:hypothetical protein